MTEIKILIVILFLIPPLNSYSQKVPGLSTGKGFSITPQITYVSSATIQLAPFSADLLEKSSLEELRLWLRINN